MPTVLIWPPDEENQYGHAALQTKKYHISFWPDGDVKRDLGVLQTLTVGVKASLVLSQHRDFHLEGNRVPRQYNIVIATDEAIDRVYEDFLRYNNIEPEEVTVAAAEKMIEQNVLPEVTLPNTKYSFCAEIILNRRGKNVSWNLFLETYVPFYHTQQSCVSFCYNVINVADVRTRTFRGICNEIPMRTFNPFNPFKLTLIDDRDLYTVGFLEKHVKKFWLKKRENENEGCCIS